MVAVVGMIAEDHPQGSVDPHQVGNPLHEIVAQAYLWQTLVLVIRGVAYYSQQNFLLSFRAVPFFHKVKEKRQRDLACKWTIRGCHLIFII